MTGPGEVTPAPRAKPLNARTLAALPVGLSVWDDQIEYLADALVDKPGAGYVLPPGLRHRFTEQHEALIRSREWLAARIAASK